ncbi:hypothetical protein [Butyrivibrio proteoclasticus]|uniref:hypothetical protein n=1 Tax=Butyrivibrio proteoclasticus TaxID=43305 RepID=UPI00047AE0BC|nr:hypothetical protein [Butyrivibrio proteoclasticus]
MKNDNIEDRIISLRNELGQLQEDMEMIDDFLKEKELQSNEKTLEYWMELKKSYDCKIMELQEIEQDIDDQEKYV